MNDGERSFQSHSRAAARGLVRPCLIAALVCLVGFAFSIPFVSFAQRRASRRPGTTAASRPAINYGKFLHATRDHQRACNTCHKVPTANWRTAGSFPDVADYPGHDACVSCHRQQFFRGARPPICTICHVKVSPRDEARFTFRHPEHARQFTIEFPHDKHQDVIASLRELIRPPFRPAANRKSQPRDGSPFTPISLTQFAHATDVKQGAYNNCTICHDTNTKPPVSPSGGWADRFAPTADTFKTAPAAHNACFNCHWKAQEPTRENCAGCHSPAAPYQPLIWPNRISVKFTHAREQHVAECTTCHINITKSSTLRGLKPDVPITACAACHKTSTAKDIVTLEIELDRRKQNPAFTCAKCHTSEVGRKEAPASHDSLFLD